MRVKNRSWSPRILAVKDRRIALAARGTAEIDRDELESPEVERLIADGSLIVLPEPEAAAEGPRGGEAEGGGSGAGAAAGGSGGATPAAPGPDESGPAGPGAGEAGGGGEAGPGEPRG